MNLLLPSAGWSLNVKAPGSSETIIIFTKQHSVPIPEDGKPTIQNQIMAEEATKNHNLEQRGNT
jgi:hypothetical protein